MEPSRVPPFHASGHGPHTALAPRRLIASARAEGRAPLNRRAHLGFIRPSPSSCDLPLPLRVASPPRLSISSSVGPTRASTFVMSHPELTWQLGCYRPP